MPHAWKAGPQTLLLMKQLEAMDDGGVVVMTVPGNPYRCPPGPYERACMIGHFLKTHKPKSKLVIFDAKPTFSKQAAFEEAFEKYYAGIIDLNLTNEIDNFDVVRVDPKALEVETKSGIKLKGAVVNVIPPQTAGNIAVKAGCTEGAWCPIQPQNFMSAKVDGIYVIGDAAIAAEMPKSAFSANSQGRVVAADLLADLKGAIPSLPATATPAGRCSPPRTASRSAPTTRRATRTASRSWCRTTPSSPRRGRGQNCGARTTPRASPGTTPSSRTPSTIRPALTHKG